MHYSTEWSKETALSEYYEVILCYSPRGSAERIQALGLSQDIKVRVKTPAEAAIAKKWGYPVIFDVTATTFDEANALINAGITDFNVSGECMYDINKLRKLAKRANLRYKAPNLTHVSGSTIAMQDEFLFPEAVSLYEGAISTIEICGYPIAKPILLDIYKSGKWSNALRYLSPALRQVDPDINSAYLPPMIYELKTICKHECGKCNECQRAINISQMMQTRGLKFTYKEEK